MPEQPRPGQRGHVVRRDVGGGSLEAADSPVKGKIGYVAAPVASTRPGWLYAWAWGIQMASTKKDNAWKFVSWASSKEYEELVGQELGWSKVPAGKRASTYDNADYLKVASAFATPTKAAIESADPNNPGVQPRPRRDPVRRHPRVPRPRHPGLPGRQLGDRRPDERPGAEHRSGAAEDVAERYQSARAVNGRAASGRSTRAPRRIRIGTRKEGS